MSDGKTLINAMLTKAFFVDMLVKDIPLERAVLDLIDNCIDGAKRMRPENEPDFTGLRVRLDLNEKQFEIEDNCGGFDIEAARDYAFRFGRPAQAKSTDYSIGQFGVGMKRALFKSGRYFEVNSTTPGQRWSMKVDVDAWEESPDWNFEFDKIVNDQDFAAADCGTRILVQRLRPEVASRFGSEYFRRQLSELIRSHQREFLARGLEIDLGGIRLTNTDLRIRSGGAFKPVIEELTFDEATDAVIRVRIVAGVADSVPSDAGWYIVCNGRVILSADRSDQTGWGSVAEQKDGIPKYHNQYARFRGVVFFDCRSSSKLPWNTTKTGLDTSSSVWQAVYPRILDHTRTIINFLNSLDDEIEEFGQSSPLLVALTNETQPQDVERYAGFSAFSWNKSPRVPGPRTIRIQYSREASKIEALMTALGLHSAKAVGETTFDMIFNEQIKGEE